MRHGSKLVLAFWLLGCGNAADPDTAGDDSAGAGSGGTATSGGSGPASGGASTGGSSNVGGANVGAGGSSAAGSAAGGSAGSSSDAGSGGDGGSAPHVVEACPTAEMGGPGVVGVFEEITPQGVTSVTSTVVDQLDTRVVYAGTDGDGLYRSSDCGATWTKVNTGENGSKLDTGTMWNLAIDPVDTNVLYTGTLYGDDLGLFKSTSAGVDWETVFPTPEIAPVIGFTGTVAVDPTAHEHLLLTLHDQCKGDLNWGCMAESTDSGLTWELIKVPPSTWSHNASPFPVGGDTWLYGAGSDGVFLTENGGDTWDKVADQSMNQMYHATDDSYYIASLTGLIRSTDLHTWTAVPGGGRSIAVIGDGQHVMVTDDHVFKADEPFRQAPESDPETWTTLDSPEGLYGANSLAYDPDHHILYAPSTEDGLWRMVTY